MNPAWQNNYQIINKMVSNFPEKKTITKSRLLRPL